MMWCVLLFTNVKKIYHMQRYVSSLLYGIYHSLQVTWLQVVMDWKTLVLIFRLSLMRKQLEKKRPFWRSFFACYKKFTRNILQWREIACQIVHTLYHHNEKKSYAIMLCICVFTGYTLLLAGSDQEKTLQYSRIKLYLTTIF
jgi:hypothetical protein